MTIFRILVIFCLLISASSYAFLQKVMGNWSFDVPTEVGCYTSPMKQGEKVCEDVRGIVNSYRALYIRDSKNFFKQLNHNLSLISKKKEYRYTFILIAALSEREEFLPELRKIASLEGKEKSFVNHFAKSAIERIEKGECVKSDNYLLKEVCEQVDSRFRRVNLLKDALK